jgi:CheY-like chemotaxis protein
MVPMKPLWVEDDMMPDSEPTGLGLRVLVVEDNADTAESTATILRILGHAVEVASDGLTALEIADAGKPDVILLDLGLPGMNGYEVAKRLNSVRTGPRPLIIAVSGYGPDAGKPQPGDTGIDLHMVKPAATHDLHTVLTRFREFIGRSGAA